MIQNRMKHEMKNKKALWVIRAILTGILAAAMLAVWPGYAVYEQYISETNSYHCTETEPLAGSEKISQYFVPQMSMLDEIEIAVQYNEPKAQKETIRFEVCCESGECILATDIELEQIPNGGYYGIEIGKRVKKGEIYYWTITAPKKEDCQLTVMYTENLAYQAVENTYVTKGDERYGTEAVKTVSQYVYRVHPDKAVILGNYWTVFLIVWLVCLEMADRIWAKFHNS